MGSVIIESGWLAIGVTLFLGINYIGRDHLYTHKTL